MTSEKCKFISGSIQRSVLETVFFLMYVQDISEDITANVKFFVVDDTKIIDVIQAELDKLSYWPEKNNLLFDGSKFQLLRSGQD